MSLDSIIFTGYVKDVKVNSKGVQLVLEKLALKPGQVEQLSALVGGKVYVSVNPAQVQEELVFEELKQA